MRRCSSLDYDQLTATWKAKLGDMPSPIRQATAADVVVIGAGIVGMLVARELSIRGASVALMDQRGLGSASSVLNAGGVRQQFFQEENIGAAVRTVSFLAGFAAGHGIDISFRQNGYLYLYTTERQQERLRTAVAAQNALGVPSRLVGTDEICELVPGIATADLLGGCFGPTDGYLDPKVLVAAIAKITRRSGVAIYEGTRATGLEIIGDRVTAVVTTVGRYAAGAVVNSAGAWAPAVAALHGGSLPIRPCRSQVFAISEAPTLSPRLPATFDLSRGFYVRPAGSAVWSGSGFKPALASAPLTLEAQWLEADELHRRLVVRLPELAGSRFSDAWAGVLEVTPDYNPIIGWTGPANLYTAAGFSGHGICIAPGLAAYIAEEILGDYANEALGLYRPDRFSSGVPPRPEAMWLTEPPLEFSAWTGVT